MKLLAKTSILAAVMTLFGHSTCRAVSVLLIDDSGGLPVQSAWTTALASLGHTFVVETIATNANPVSNFSNFDTVIWTVGDRAYDNLTAANWAKMTSYANSGGSLIYAGGHSVYQENNVGHAAIESFFGVSGTLYNMPMFGSSTVTGTGNSVGFGTSSYGISPWTGGYYGDMFSGFGVSTGTGLINKPPGSSGGPYVVVENAAGNVQLWGLDLNHINSADRSAFLAASLATLPSSNVPDGGSSIALLGLAMTAAAGFRRKFGI